MNLLSLKKTHLLGKELLLILILFFSSVFSLSAQTNCKADFKYEIDHNTKEVKLAARSNKSPVKFGWKFSDGTVLRGEKVKHSFRAPGSYKVCLIAIAFDSSANQRCTTEVCKEITIVDCDRLEGRFVYETDGTTISVKGGSNSQHAVYGFSFGDGTVKRGQTLRHTYAQDGVYEVCLIIKDTLYGCVIKECKRVEISSNDCGLRAKFGYRQSENDFKFIAKANLDPARFVWEFGDGETGYGDEVKHSYDKPGVYRVCLTVYAKANDGSICSTKVCDKVVVRKEDKCDLRAKFELRMDGNKIVVEGIANEDNVHYFWAFGDGSDASGQKARHEYDRPGEYEVCLVVFNPETKCKVCVCRKIVIEKQCDLRAEIRHTVHRNFVNFHARTNAHGNAEYYWDFGDGNTGRGKNIRHTYAQDGRYLVTLSILDRKEGCRIQVRKYIYSGSRMSTQEVELNTEVTTADDPDTRPVWIAKASPVPSVNKVSISADVEIKEVKVFDNKGNLVLTTENKDLDISDLSKGFYFAHVYAADGSMSTVKFIKE